MKRTLVAILITGVGYAYGQTPPTLTTNKPITKPPAISPAQLQLLQQQMISTHALKIQRLLEQARINAIAARTRKTNASITTLQQLRSNIAGRTISYNVIADQNGSAAVYGSPVVNGGTGSSSTGGGTGGAITQTSTCGTPTVSVTSLGNVSPGDALLINGTCFGDANTGQVHFLFAQQDLQATIALWSGSQLYVYMPDVSGVQPTDGQAYVVTADGHRSGLISFHFVPQYETAAIAVVSSSGMALWSDDIKFSCGMDMAGNALDRTNQGLDPRTGYTFVGAQHSGGVMFGCKDTDVFFEGNALHNGWVVSSYPFSPQLSSSDPTEANAYIEAAQPGTGVGTSNPRASVHWVATANDYVVYAISILATGPKGTNP